MKRHSKVVDDTVSRFEKPLMATLNLLTEFANQTVTLTPDHRRATMSSDNRDVRHRSI
jgi:hypothetical protein